MSNGCGEYLVPVILHNNAAYDGHLLLQGFRQKYAEYTLQNGQVRHADIKIIPLNSEKYLQIQIGNLFSGLFSVHSSVFGHPGWYVT